jgi:hypothetical protein
MFKRIPGNYDYSISLSGEVNCLRENILKPSIVDGKMTVEMYGKVRCFDVAWLGLIAHFEVDLPKNLEDIYFVDISTNVVKVTCGKVMRFKRPIMASTDIRVIPGFTKYGITKYGKIYDLTTFSTLKAVEYPTKYPTINLYDPDYGVKRNLRVHRLVALAWVGNEDFVSKPIVNHIDGNKTNYHAHNLEWCTFKYNNDHAVNTGLVKEARQYKVRDIETGEIREFGSFGKVCDELGMDRTTKFKDTRKVLKPSLINGRYEVKELEDETPWMTVEEAKVTKGLYTIKITHPDGKVDTHNTNLEVIKKYKLWDISHSVKEIVRRMGEKHPELKLEVIQNVVVVPLQALKVDTMEIVEAPSIREMTRLTGLTFSSIRLALHKGEEYIFKGYAFRYNTDKEWSATLSETKHKAVPIKATSMKDGTVTIYNSFKEAAFKIPGAGYNRINNAIKNKTPYRNRYYTTVDE